MIAITACAAALAAVTVGLLLRSEYKCIENIYGLEAIFK